MLRRTNVFVAPLNHPQTRFTGRDNSDVTKCYQHAIVQTPIAKGPDMWCANDRTSTSVPGFLYLAAFVFVILAAQLVRGQTASVPSASNGATAIATAQGTNPEAG